MTLSVCYIDEFLTLFQNLAGRLLWRCGILLSTDMICPCVASIIKVFNILCFFLMVSGDSRTNLSQQGEVYI